MVGGRDNNGNGACFKNGVAKKKFFHAQPASMENFFFDRTPVLISGLK
jgi:hypothetical protein